MVNNDKNDLIDCLIEKRSMKPYGITMTFLSSNEINDIGSTIFYNQNLIHNNVKAFNALHRFKRKIEEDFRLALGKLCVAAMATSNTTRNGNRIKHPLTFYAFHIANKQKRENAIEINPNLNSISPLHIHGIILVPEIVHDRFKAFIGIDTIHKFCRLGQGSKIESCYEVNKWMRYVNRDFLAPTPSEDMHPMAFARNPAGYMYL
jgi:hypothetical protein